MPLCSCGLKVDRAKTKDNKDKDNETICCSLCNNIFHLECCNIAKADICFVKNAYKCSTCIRRGQSDLNSLPKSTLMETDTDEVIDITGNAGSKVLPPKSPAAVETQTAGAPAADVPIANDTSADASVLLQLLMREIADIKKSNAELSAEVSLLRKDNAILISKVDALQSALECNQNAPNPVAPANLDRSPKRKKKTSVATCTTPASGSASLKPISASSSRAASQIGTSPLVTAANGSTAGSSTIKPSYANTARSANRMSIRVSNNVSAERVFGSNASQELGVVQLFKKKWVHLSSFSNTVTTENISDYISKHAKIDASHISVHKLIKKDVDTQNLKFVNFKVGISENFYDKVFDATLWPEHVQRRPFHFFEKHLPMSQI